MAWCWRVRCTQACESGEHGQDAVRNSVFRQLPQYILHGEPKLLVDALEGRAGAEVVDADDGALRRVVADPARPAESRGRLDGELGDAGREHGLRGRPASCLCEELPSRAG